MTIFTQKSSKMKAFQSILGFFGLFFTILLISTQSSCSKTGGCSINPNYTNDNNTAQKTAMINFCAANNISYTAHPSGILYQIINPGSATKPNLCETISMTYTGTLLNGSKFDSGTISYPLSELIVGWQIAVPLVGKGGHIKVVIPSSLAYGSQSVGSIPANSPLFFDIILN